MPKLVYVGTPDDPQTQLITEGNVEFVKGQAVDVKDAAVYARLKENPTFSVPKEAEEPSETDEDVEALKAELDARSIKYRANASAETLRGLLSKEVAN